MATHSSILAWRISMDRGDWQATVHGVTESDTTDVTDHAHTLRHIIIKLLKSKDRKKETSKLEWYCVHAKLLQSCPTLCDPMDCSPPGFSVHGDSPGKNTGVGYHALLQGIFLTQGLNPCILWLLHCRQILYC